METAWASDKTQPKGKETSLIEESSAPASEDAAKEDEGTITSSPTETGRPDSAKASLQRPEVEAYAQTMEDKLRENDYKGGWKDCSTDYLIDKLLEETAELIRAFNKSNSSSQLAAVFEDYLETTDGEDKSGEAADVGNVAMMLADPARKIDAAKADEGDEAPK